MVTIAIIICYMLNVLLPVPCDIAKFNAISWVGTNHCQLVQ